MHYYNYYEAKNKLTEEAWEWARNDKLAVDVPHYLFIVVEEFNSYNLQGELNQLLRDLHEHRRRHRHAFDSLEILSVYFSRGCGDGETKYYLVGVRKETSTEVAQRLVKLQTEADEKIQATETKRRQQEEQEKKLLAKLQAKYGK